MTQEWRPLKDWEELYLINSSGELMRKERVVNYKDNGLIKRLPERIQTAEEVRGGYLRFKLTKNGTIKSLFVHRAVALTFIPNPDKKPCINHIDGNPKNNSIDNLEWVTHSENERHSYCVLGKKGSHLGKEIPSLHKPVLQIDSTGNVVEEYSSIKKAAEKGFSYSHIGECCSGKRKTHKNFTWQYKT